MLESFSAIGASDDPCSEIYAGPNAFSENETQALRDFVLANSNTIKVYLTLHSYGQYLLHPWGYTSDLPENEPVLNVINSNQFFTNAYSAMLAKLLLKPLLRNSAPST
ncbi:hypothetical protein PV325_008920 [Microctonus aethiopoides]|nr:hypothetical protein PV325_008920 [Microctonus aethiopoides]